ncbi:MULTISPECIES: type II toxin-antitoxin system PemK/MazF family toxin [Micromonospora]|uniref:PemK-like, MazF-like toxin of type II toxin-antitoxin system n=1 Tax=Micromonospora yangpuensis TaxID=683228 RepID=A0A1C6UAA6_9ACTN|nr:type II toxin-antitoxin system PemK/MazF family toxin [Micromonospora yangpuensis]GGL87528.1 hypothetical protein GCM10012279_01520 [Micromonospora yangpuensis]SCL51025.1 PemK-like, MazF-like toxin of type II toxin-antitoxin system [Micromonospora yangpuensis]
MPEWLPWAALILLAVVAGWAWDSWRNRPGGRPRTRPDGADRRTGAPKRPRTRPGSPPRPRTGDRAPAGTPRSGEIWWADVPYADGDGSKVRPCLVLRVERRHAEVLKITSQDKSHRDDHVPIPTGDWDPDAERDSFLDLGDPIQVDLVAFENRAGTCDQQLWRRIRTLPHLR